MNIIETTNRKDSLTKQLLDVWESAVRQTHTFLSESEILRIKGYVPDAIGDVARLLVSMDESGKPVAFLGLEGSRIEMLFVNVSPVPGTLKAVSMRIHSTKSWNMPIWMRMTGMPTRSLLIASAMIALTASKSATWASGIQKRISLSTSLRSATIWMT